MRSVPEWIGATDDTQVPPRVKRRVLNRYGKICQCCFTEIVGHVEIDHLVALVNGGGNKETNLVPLHPKCHAIKTRRDVWVKALDAKREVKRRGFKKQRNPMPGSRASGWRKRMDGTVERR